MTLVWLYAVRALFCPYGAGTSGQHGPNFIPGAAPHHPIQIFPKKSEYEELIRRLYEAISSLPPMQARRVHARYMLGMKVKDIAAMEGITPSQAGKSIHAALRRLRRYFARQKWTVNL